MAALNIAPKVERSFLQHLENFLGLFSSFHVLLTERNQTDPRTFVSKDMARIDRAHDRILQKMFWTRIDVGAGVH